MAVMDEYREEREAIKTAPFKTKVEYFFDYYKWHTFAIIAVSLFLVLMIYDMVTAKDTAFYAAFINSYIEEDEGAEAIADEFAEIIGMDSNKEEIVIDTTYFLDYVELSTDHTTFLQKLVTLTATSTIDVLSGDENSFANLAYMGVLKEVSEYMTEEEMEAYEGEFLYIDQTIVDEVEAMDALDGEYPEYTYSTNPDDLEDPVAVGLVVEEGTIFTNIIAVDCEYIVIGIVANTERFEESLEFLEYILSEE